jgi:tetratricopeptide (TPR) repeat protein
MVRLFISSLLLAGSLSAQFSERSTDIVQPLTVHVVRSGGHCDGSIRVTLIDLKGPVDEEVPDGRCTVEFGNVSAGSYHIRVSAPGFATAEMDLGVGGAGPQYVDIKLMHEEQAGLVGSSSNGATTDVADLGVPANARRQYEKANQLMAKHDWTQALEKLNHALTMYPDYAAAYNSMGVVFAKLGDTARERESLQKAVGIDDHYVSAHVNLGRLDLKAGDFAGAETEFDKASRLAPTDATILVLLSYAELQSRHFDAVVATSHKAHSMPQSSHAFVHWTAAQALDEEHRTPDARLELRLFLSEEPTGPRADAARAALEKLQAAP